MGRQLYIQPLPNPYLRPELRRSVRMGDTTTSFLGQTGLSRGIANNNPGNIVISSNDWDGKIPEAQNTDGTFEQFSTLDDGLRAMALDAINIIKTNNDTLAQYITTYAPPSGSAGTNDTQGYINQIASATGLDPNANLAANLDATVLAALMRAQITVENGATDGALVTDQNIAESINMLPALIIQEIGNLVAQNPGTSGVVIAIVIGGLFWIITR